MIQVFIAERVASLSACQSDRRAWKSANTARKKKKKLKTQEAGLLLERVIIHITEQEKRQTEQVRLGN